MIAELLKMFKTRWLTPPKPATESFKGRIVIVTGSTSGIGLEAAVKFAALDADKVIIAARDLGKGETTKVSVEKRVGQTGQLEVWELDMNSFDSVVAFAKRVESLPYLDVAVLNAGVHRGKYVESRHGWEEDLQVNTLSTTLLAILLLPTLKKSKPITGKIPVLEFVNSGLHQNAIVSEEIQKQPSVIEWYNKPENFNSHRQYSYTKMFLMHIASQLAAGVSSGDVIITSICPGVVRTDLARDHYFPGVGLLLAIAGLLIIQSPEVGANPVLSAVTQGEMVHGRFWKSDAIQPVAPSLAGDANKKLGLRVWGEIIEVLKKEAPVVVEALDTLQIA